MEDNKEFIRLNTVRRVDPHVSAIVDSAVGTALYTYESDGENWSKTDVEGTLMLYRREAPPYNMLTIINRLNKTNFVEPVSPSCEMEVKLPFLLLKSSKGTIYCIWFSESKDVHRIYESIKNKIAETTSKVHGALIFNDPAIAGAVSVGEDIMSMLSKAHGDFEIKKQDIVPGQRHNDEVLKSSPLHIDRRSLNPVADFFAKVGSLNTLPGNSPARSSTADNAASNPVLQQIFQGAAAVGGQAFVSPNSGKPGTSVPIDVPNSSMLCGESSITSKVNQTTPMSLQELEGKLKENLSISHVKEELIGTKDNGFNIHNQSDSLLLSPQVFSTTSSSPIDKHKHLLLSGFSAKPFNGSKEVLNCQPNLLSNFGITPLTQEQLVQAFTVLLKKKDFVSQLHQAYIEAIQQSLKSL